MSVDSHTPKHPINVEYLNRYNAVILFISGLIFALQLIIHRVKYDYLIVVFGGIILFFSYWITILTYYRQLFTATPTHISGIKPNEAGAITIFVYPHNLDKDKITVFISKFTLQVSNQYKIDDVVYNADKLKIIKCEQNIIEYEVNRCADIDAKFTIVLVVNVNIDEIPENGRFVRYSVYYQHKPKSHIFSYIEKHQI